MKRIITIVALLQCALQTSYAQDLASRLYEQHGSYAEDHIGDRRIKHKDVKQLVSAIGERGMATVNKVGTSIEGRELYLISLGEGDTDVFLWSQMHGDESTATMAIFDILNFFHDAEDDPEKERMLKNLRIHFLPMLNPDGAERFTRRNRLGIDMNRDALRLQSPESRTLKRVRDSLEADFGFNLHDQSRYYNAYRTDKPATVSFLAPAYNYEKSVNEVRANAMKVIVLMNEVLQGFVPGQVGRYNDDFEPRAFGDNIQKWGTSTILIESGGQYDDREKQEIRKLNFTSILAALDAIASKAYAPVPVERYFDIPNNDRKLFDLKLEGVTYELLGTDYRLDVGIQQGEQDLMGHEEYFLTGSIGDLGDLSTFYGYRTLDASGLTYLPAKIYPETMPDLQSAMALDHEQLIRDGYGYIRVQELPVETRHIHAPLHMISAEFKVSPEIRVGNNPSFYLADDRGELRYYVVNGFLTDLRDPGAFDSCCSNALIMR